VGTQRIEAHLTKLFSQAKIQRMDADSTRLKDAHRRILEIFHKGEIQILVGTQMIAKGLDFPNVTLVGVMSADVAMSLPDFRMGEHTFQLLTQVAGRAGRGSKSGEVVVQTFTPFHPIIRAAVDQDYLKFYAAEIAYRRQLGYPPFTRLVSILIQGKSETKIVQIARKMAVQLKKDLNQSNRIFGPQPAPISKIKGHFRWQMILFYPRGKSIHKNLKEVLSFFREEKGIKISIDVDPVSLI
jgi:primosomal protein N' (replication factor Y)